MNIIMLLLCSNQNYMIWEMKKYYVFFWIVYTNMNEKVVSIQEADMRYKIVIDSCGELTDALKKDNLLQVIDKFSK